jgi:hypothetical protein
MKLLTQILLILAIAVTATVGIACGLCGAAGFTLGVGAVGRGASGVGTIFLLALLGFGVAIGAVMLISQVLWKALRRASQDPPSQDPPRQQDPQ